MKAHIVVTIFSNGNIIVELYRPFNVIYSRACASVENACKVFGPWKPPNCICLPPGYQLQGPRHVQIANIRPSLKGLHYFEVR